MLTQGHSVVTDNTAISEQREGAERSSQRECPLHNLPQRSARSKPQLNRGGSKLPSLDVLNLKSPSGYHPSPVGYVSTSPPLQSLRCVIVALSPNHPRHSITAKAAVDAAEQQQDLQLLRALSKDQEKGLAPSVLSPFTIILHMIHLLYHVSP